MLDILEELDLLTSNLIPFLGLFQVLSSASGTFIETVLMYSCNLSLSDMACFLWFPDYKVHITLQ